MHVSRGIVLAGAAGPEGSPGTPGTPGERGEPGAQGGFGPAGERGAAGADALTVLVSIAAGEEGRSNGGVLIQVGWDNDHNGELSEQEIMSAEPLCHGIQGDTRTFSPLVEVEPIEPGDSTCPDGGVSLRAGLDGGDGTHAGNGQLDTDEISSEHAVCREVADRDAGSCIVGVPGSRKSQAPAWVFALLLVTLRSLRHRIRSRRS